MANKKITDLMSGTPTRDSYLESATDVGGTMVSRKFKVGAVADVNNVQIANEYDDTATYVYGAYCIKDGVLYRCTTAISVAEAWTVAHWTAVMVTGEYKRVRIMTKAQFDLLSNDEKDGFIYVSDYPTKIQDIDNVSLTTSDNGKLLGVSVSGSDISVVAVALTADDVEYSSGVSVGDKLDSLDNLFLTQTYTATKTIATNGVVALLGSDMGYNSIPTGYTPIVYTFSCTNSNDLFCNLYSLTGTGATQFAVIRNISTETQTDKVCNITITFVKSAYL